MSIFLCVLLLGQAPAPLPPGLNASQAQIIQEVFKPVLTPEQVKESLNWEASHPVIDGPVFAPASPPVYETNILGVLSDKLSTREGRCETIKGALEIYELWHLPHELAHKDIFVPPILDTGLLPERIGKKWIVVGPRFIYVSPKLLNKAKDFVIEQGPCRLLEVLVADEPSYLAKELKRFVESEKREGPAFVSHDASHNAPILPASVAPPPPPLPSVHFTVPAVPELKLKIFAPPEEKLPSLISPQPQKEYHLLDPEKLRLNIPMPKVPQLNETSLIKPEEPETPEVLSLEIVDTTPAGPGDVAVSGSAPVPGNAPPPAHTTVIDVPGFNVSYGNGTLNIGFGDSPKQREDEALQRMYKLAAESTEYKEAVYKAYMDWCAKDDRFQISESLKKFKNPVTRKECVQGLLRVALRFSYSDLILSGDSRISPEALKALRNLCTSYPSTIDTAYLNRYHPFFLVMDSSARNQALKLLAALGEDAQEIIPTLEFHINQTHIRPHGTYQDDPGGWDAYHAGYFVCNGMEDKFRETIAAIRKNIADRAEARAKHALAMKEYEAKLKVYLYEKGILDRSREPLVYWGVPIIGFSSVPALEIAFGIMPFAIADATSVPAINLPGEPNDVWSYQQKMCRQVF